MTVQERIAKRISDFESEWIERGEIDRIGGSDWELNCSQIAEEERANEIPNLTMRNRNNDPVCLPPAAFKKLMGNLT